MINYCIPGIHYSNIRTPTPCGARTGVTKRLLAFDSFCGARMRVTERLLDYCCHCGAQTGVVKCVLAFNSLCGGQTGGPKHPSAISAELEQGLENVY